MAHTGGHPITETTCDDIACVCHRPTLLDPSTNPADAAWLLDWDRCFLGRLAGNPHQSNYEFCYMHGLSLREFGQMMTRQGWLFPRWYRRLL